MSHLSVIRAWRDEDYRASLTPEQQSTLPENPAGLIALSEAGLGRVQGGLVRPETLQPGNCTEFTRNCPSICQVFSC